MSMKYGGAPSGTIAPFDEIEIKSEHPEAAGSSATKTAYGAPTAHGANTDLSAADCGEPEFGVVAGPVLVADRRSSCP